MAPALTYKWGRNSPAEPDLRLEHLAPLGELLPEPLRAPLAAGDAHRLIVVPVGELWLVPWSAVPVAGGRVPGEAADYIVSPSLTVQRQLAARGAAALGTTPIRRTCGAARSSGITSWPGSRPTRRG